MIKESDYSRINILVVDDDPAIYDFAKFFFGKAGIKNIQFATSGKEAFLLFQKKGFNLIISDFDMNGMNGLELLHFVRESDKEFPFLLLSGKRSEEIAIQAIHEGVTAYFNKDMDTASLYAQIIHSAIESIGYYEAKQKLKNKEKMYRALVESAKDVIVVHNNEGVLTFINEYGATVYGKKSEELIGKKLEDLFPTNLAAQFKASVNDVIESGKTLFKSRKYTFPDREIWMETMLLPLKDDDGNTNEVMGISRDITKRMEIECALRKNDKVYKALFQASSDPIIIGELDGKILDCNISACNLFGYTKEEMLGLTSFDIAEEKFRENHGTLVKTLIKKNTLSVIMDGIRRDGTRFSMQVTTDLMQNEGRSEIVAFIRDLPCGRLTKSFFEPALNLAGL